MVIIYVAIVLRHKLKGDIINPRALNYLLNTLKYIARKEFAFKIFFFLIL